MKNISVLVLLLLGSSSLHAQQRIRVPLNLLLQIRIPIQPGDQSWANWHTMASLQDSTQTIRIDRRVQGFPAFIPRNDAPFYNESQRNEIRFGFEKILNPDMYFQTEQAYMEFSHAFMEKYVLRK